MRITAFGFGKVKNDDLNLTATDYLIQLAFPSDQAVLMFRAFSANLCQIIARKQQQN